MKIAGVFTLGSGFAADGAVMMTDRGFARIQRNTHEDRASIGLVKLDRDADRQAVYAELEKMANQVKDIDVCTRERLVAEETNLWVNETPIGIIFQSGVALAFVVGLVIVYQVLSSDVAAHLGEYATLKAMGYADRFLSQVVVWQAVILSVAGYLPGLLMAQFLYWMTRRYAGIPIAMNSFRVGLVLGLAMTFCIISGFGALRKVRKADPADLF